VFARQNPRVKTMDSFEWDDDKNNLNIKKHGIDFEDAISIFLGFMLEHEDDRFDYGEVRILALGEVGGTVIAVVYTMRGESCRLISARKAKRNERDAYYQAVSAQPPDGTD
jgi:uncharacterized DUF497 family protein